MTPHVVWTIAGFDPSSGAGVTADLMTFAAHGLFGCSAITALTVQSTLGVAGVEVVEPKLLRRTLAHLSEDLPPEGVKIGMLGGLATMREIADWVSKEPQFGPGAVSGFSSGRAVGAASSLGRIRDAKLDGTGGPERHRSPIGRRGRMRGAEACGASSRAECRGDRRRSGNAGRPADYLGRDAIRLHR